MDRPRIGYLTGELSWEATYPDQTWRMCCQQARLHACDLRMLVGRSRVGQGQQHPDRVLYRLLGGGSLDGLLVSSAVITSMDPAYVDSFLASLPDIPIVLLATAPTSLPCLVVDNRIGMDALMDHLITVHGRRRVAMLAGPLSHPDARSRLDCWRRTLQAAGLPHDDALWVECDWLGVQLPEKLDRLLAKAGSFDALVCSNDVPAIDAMDLLRGRGFRVPEEVSVVGFDGIASTFFSDPPLTTVVQPLWRQIQTAFDLLLSADRRKTWNSSACRFDSQLVVRGSCGCCEHAWTEADLPAIGNPDELSLDLPHAVPAAVTDWLRKGWPREPLLFRALEELDRLAGTGGLDAEELTAQRETARQIRGTLQRRLFRRLVDSQRNTDRLHALGRLLTSGMNLESLPTVLRDSLPGMGFPRFALSLVVDGGRYPGRFLPVLRPGQVLADPPERFHQLCSFPPAPGSDPVFAAPALAPPGWLELCGGGDFLFLPLVANEAWYGLLVLEGGEDSALTARGLQETLAVYLDREFHYRELVEQAVEERTRTRLETEKRQLLSTLVAGIAHEVNTPLGSTVTSVSFMADKLRELHRQFGDGAIRRSDLESFIADQQAGFGIVGRALDRVTELLANFRKVSAETMQAEAISFDLGDLLRQILKNLDPRVQARGAHLEVRGPDRMPMNTLSAPFLDIVANLVGNALDYAWPDSAAGTVRLEYGFLAERPGWVYLVVADDGKGIPPDYRKRIFEPFFTIMRHKGGTGLGLNIVHNLVTLALRGTIRCEGMDGAGSCFVMEFPRDLPLY